MTISRDKALKFLKEADFKAKLFSKDEKRKVGAIILENESLIQLSCGYNGLPRRLKETKKRWLKKNKDLYVIHAETNAIVQAARTNSNINNSIMVCNRFPCHNCCLNIIQAGIKILVTSYYYSCRRTILILCAGCVHRFTVQVRIFESLST